MAKSNRPAPQGHFDADMDGECCGLIGGEMTDGDAMLMPTWDWRPDDFHDLGAEHSIKKLGELDLSEIHTAREGSR